MCNDAVYKPAKLWREMRLYFPLGRNSGAGVIVGPFGMAVFGLIWLCWMTIFVSVAAIYYFFALAYRLGVAIDTWWRARNGQPPRATIPGQRKADDEAGVRLD